ncbi:MAG: hypothetical protein JXB18_04510, partial [Sedimentisphaerales bacterium]|nr:hypothetical protein [Sedimentisphaerales bacterium]
WALGRAMLLERRLKRSRRPLPVELMVEQIETLARLWDYPGGFKVWLMDGIGQPFVWGLWRGAIYLPTRFQSIQTDRQKAIVIHEMAHVVRLDAFVNLLQILIQGVFWFHPLVWLANRVIRQEREKCCDEIAVARLGTAPREYGSAIVDTLLQEVQTTLAIPTLAVAGPVKNIEDRVKTIMQPGRRFLRRPSMAAILIIGLLAAVIVPTTIALTHKVTPPDYVLSGTVADAQSGQPIAGAIVLDDGYGPQPYQKGITDDAGKFEYKSWNEEHNITARADGYNSQSMVFTTAPFDNSRALHFKLSKAAPGEKVDLVPAEFDLQIDSQRGVCFPVVTITNEGKAALPKMKLRFYRGSPDQNRDEVGNEHRGWHEAGPIEPGKTWNERTDGFHLDDGVYEFAVVLDYDHAIAETDETNNAMSLQVKVVNGQVVEKLAASSIRKQLLTEARVPSSQLPNGIIETVLLPEYLESHTVLSLKTGQLMPQQQADDSKEPYLLYAYTFPPGQSPSQYTVNTIPERYIGVEAGGMNTGGFGWAPESAGLQRLWSIDRIEALPDCPQRARITIGDVTTNGTFIGLPLTEPEREKQWPFITAFKGDDGTSGVFEITKIENRKICVRFKALIPSETAIRLERKELLQKMLDTEEKKFQSGISGPVEVLEAKLNLLAVKKELAKSSQERITVLQQIAALRQEAENITKLMFESGRATEAELNQAKLERLKAEEELAAAGLPEEAHGATQKRILRFPDAETRNVLFYVEPEKEDSLDWWWPNPITKNTFSVPARGEAAVDADKTIGLILHSSEEDDPLSALEGLAPDDLHTLIIHGKSGRSDRQTILDTNVASCIRLEQLHCLILNGAIVSKQAIKKLTGMKSIERLSILSSQLDDEDVGQISQMKGLKGLRVYGDVGNKGFEFISTMENLEELFTGGKYVGDESIRYISTMKNLKTLTLAKAQCTEKGFQYLSALNSLETLKLLGFEIGPEGAGYLAKIKNLKSLAINRAISDQAMEQLKTMNWLTQLTLQLGLQHSGNKLTDAGLVSLNEMKSLEFVSIYYGRFTDDGLKQLSGLTNLKRLEMPNTTLSEEAYQYLQKVLPDLERMEFRNFGSMQDKIEEVKNLK